MNTLSGLLLFGMPGPLELIVILLIVLLVVGPKRLPELMRSIGKSIQSFKKGMKEGDDENASGHTPENDNKPYSG
ncbi:MAG: twin-arginine translocase TatA/TatE family subunit [Candidatus Omnitrophica bacterium]|nr:twin-arginine translocase TatA/TatE family subunit [Candidatus Omnitrophota bacterium]